MESLYVALIRSRLDYGSVTSESAARSVIARLPSDRLPSTYKESVMPEHNVSYAFLLS